jgi:hypothetical protein
MSHKDIGESFGLIVSEHLMTFEGLLSEMKGENHDNLDTVLANTSEFEEHKTYLANAIIDLENLNINSQLLNQPLSHGG